MKSDLIMEKMKEFDDYVPPLSNESVKSLKSQYGAPFDISDMSMGTRPPTPGQSLSNASRYIEKMNRKGFNNEPDMSYFINNMYNRTERRNSTGNVQRSTDLETLFRREPYQEFWLTSEFVKKTIEEVRGLVFDDPIYAELFVGRFFDLVATVVRVMKHRKMLDQKNAPRSHLKAAMKHFLTECHRLREDILTQALVSSHIVLDLCPDEILVEFDRLVPRKKQNEQQNLTNGIEKKVLDNVLNGPKTYRLPDMPTTKIPVPALTERKASRSIKARVTQSTLINGTKRRLSDYSSFWTYSDPLATTRQGKMHPLEMVTLTGADLSFEPLVEEDMEEKEEDMYNEVPLVDEIWNTADLPSHQNQLEGNQNQHQHQLETHQVDGASIAKFNEGKNRSAAMKFLLSHDIVSDSNGQEGDAQIHRQLERIWDTLGFTVQQKINLMLRYSQDPDSNTRFSNTLGYWDSALSSVQGYEKIYKDFKFFLNYEALHSSHREPLIEKYFSDLSKAEEHVHQTADILFTGTGDHLIFRKQLSEDLIRKRRRKLQSMVQSMREG